eukprot:scaffold91_cov127-Cylindrotheca_fusiformis.AAC.7
MAASLADETLVVVDYTELLEGSSDEKLMKCCEQAFGDDGIGIIGIANIPGFVEAKASVLQQAHPLAHLPENILKELEDSESMYNAGWSHGKEMLKAGKPDLAKGSFYFNPLVDVPNPRDRKQYPASYPVNRWPNVSLPQLEPAAKTLGSMMKDVAVLVSKHIDTYARFKNKDYPNQVIHKALVDTEKVKGRLLYYFPLPESEAGSEDSWIGWHNDSGFLTALAGDLYMDKEGNVVKPPLSSEAGLYVARRNGQAQKVAIPPDVMAIQIGECTQILTGGAVVATPHCVRGAPNLARASLACFIDVPPAMPLSLPQGSTTSSILSTESNRVPTLNGRWEDGIAFGDFLQRTFEAYYKA